MCTDVTVAVACLQRHDVGHELAALASAVADETAWLISIFKQVRATTREPAGANTAFEAQVRTT